MAEPGERWPPVYDAEDLAAAIRDLAQRPDLEAAFFDPVSERSGPLCQGDVLALLSGVPVIDADGIVREDDQLEFWLTIGNTCDFERKVEDVEWTQVVPLMELMDVTPEELADLRAYRATRRFYVPSWPGMDARRVFAADLIRPAPLHKAAIGMVANVVARLSRPAWFLLNGCLVRFLARDDGRFD